MVSPWVAGACEDPRLPGLCSAHRRDILDTDPERWQLQEPLHQAILLGP